MISLPFDRYGGGEDPYGGDYGYGGSGSRGSEPPPEIKEITSSGELKDFIAEEPLEAVAIGFFDETTNNDDKEIFTKVLRIPLEYYF